MSESAPARPLEQGGPPHEEDTSIPRRPYVLFCVFFLTALAVIGLLLRGLQLSILETMSRATPSPLEKSWQPPPSPQLQGTRVHPRSPHEDLEAYLQIQQQELHSYGWVDRSEGIARIPVDRAMTLILERGVLRSSPNAAAAETQPSDDDGPAEER